MKKILIILPFIFMSCSINDENIVYEEKLVLWANIQANFPLVDTVFVSRSAALDENAVSEELWISDAEVRVIGDSINLLLQPVAGRAGRYFTDEDYVFQGGGTYQVLVIHENDTVSGITTVPEKMEITSVPESNFECDGNVYTVPEINVNNFNPFFFPPITGSVDTVILRQGKCFTESFASYPLFQVDFNEEDYQTVRILNYALEADSVGPEPYNDINNNGLWDSNEYYEDWNQNGIHDSCFINLIYDSAYVDIYELWKSRFLRGSKNNPSWYLNTPYRYNPWTWRIETAPVSVSWLFYDYYGLQLLVFQATDDATFNYFQGMPEFNPYVLPNSNIVNGYGLVSSSASVAFLVYIKKDDS
ncbi:MAG: DUF4249 family protein [Candidatus Marinimicrobia bacterium]|jgi:hypothetical protein|nr:DUF4249 family protein [Candidatus Neomarinimicrobiota bacterium]MDP7474403.1 DUF4249 family protein [Candidatus Neomarinimicrobiota bacterium]|tara:strand:- start:1667 stop:2746 length:1080 start_codon:yes stop_codon:yes gene_type:complete